MPRARMVAPLAIAVQRQHAQVNEIRQHIKQDDRACAHRQRERQVALRIVHFAGGEGHVVPGVGREQRTDLRHGKDGQQARPARSGRRRRLAPDAAHSIRRCARSSRRSWRRWPRRCVPENPSSTRPSSAAVLAKVKTFCTSAPVLHAEDVQHREENHDQDGGEILRVQADIHVAQHHRPDGNRRHMRDVHRSSWWTRPKGRRRRETCRRPRRRRRWFRSG